MRGKIRQFLHSEIHGLHEAAYLIGVSAVFSQILALVRDRLFASTFGAGPELDTYYAAFRVPDLAYATIASFVSVNVLIPALAKEFGNSSDATLAMRRFLDQVFTVFCGAMLIACGALWYYMPKISPIVVPGFPPSQVENLILLSRIMLLSPFFLGLSGLISSATQILHRYIVYAFSPVLYNIGIISGVVLFYPLFGIAGLAWGVAVGAFLHFWVQVPSLRSARLMPSISVRISWRTMWHVVSSSLPRTMTLAFSQVTLAVLTAIASGFGVGAIAVFSFASNLQSVPLSVIGASYSVAAFPALSKLYSDGKKEEFVHEIARATRHVIFWSLPVSALVIALSRPIVDLLLSAGRFSAGSALLASKGLAYFAWSLPFQAIMLLVVRAYYAAGKTARPFFINLFSSVATVIAAILLVKLIPEGCGAYRLCHERVLILPIALTGGWVINGSVLWMLLKRDFRGMPSMNFVIAQAIFASLLAYSMATLTMHFGDKELPLAVLGPLAGILGLIGAYYGFRKVKSRELIEIERAIRRRFAK